MTFYYVVILEPQRLINRHIFSKILGSSDNIAKTSWEVFVMF
jgi:hypothetical protein